MMKKVYTALIFLALLPCARALAGGGVRFSYGLEWSYTSTFLRSWQYNFICNEGYRIIDQDESWRYFSNGSIIANAGADLGRSFNLSVYSGLSGVYFKRWMIPVELRLRYCPTGMHNNGLICFAGASAMFPTSVRRETCFAAGLGAGYRVAIFRNISIDLLISAHLVTDHDQIADPDTGASVPTLDITKNASQYASLRFTAAINF